MDNVELIFEEDALKAIAGKAYDKKTGARGLRSIIEETLMDIMFEIPSRKDVKQVIIDADTILKKSEPRLVMNK